MAELYEQWMAELERKGGRSAKTINNYRQTYRHNIGPTLGSVKVSKVTTRMLTDLYGAHQRRELAPRSLYQIHATISSMMTQACRWGWRDSNPAQWAEPPSAVNSVPVVPTPAEVRRLISAAERSKRPEYGRVIFLAATTGLRRGEICALRLDRDIDLDRRAMIVSRAVVEIEGQGLVEAPTKTRRIRQVALDPDTIGLIEAQRLMLEARAVVSGVALANAPYLFSDSLDAGEPWRPRAVTLFFKRLAKREGLERLSSC